MMIGIIIIIMVITFKFIVIMVKCRIGMYFVVVIEVFLLPVLAMIAMG